MRSLLVRLALWFARVRCATCDRTRWAAGSFAAGWRFGAGLWTCDHCRFDSTWRRLTRVEP